MVVSQRQGLKVPLEELLSSPEKGEPLCAAAPQDEWLQREAQRAEVWVQPAAGQLLLEQLLCRFCHFKGWDCGWCLQNPGG